MFVMGLNLLPSVFQIFDRNIVYVHVRFMDYEKSFSLSPPEGSVDIGYV